MDQLKRPLAVPPEFGVYAEQNDVFRLCESMLAELLVYKPSDPLDFLVKYLNRPAHDVPRVMVYGPPASGQHTLSKLAARKLKAIHIQPQRIVDEDQTSFGEQARELQRTGKEVPATVWAELFSGWVIEGFPRTREQALALKAKGVLVKHFVCLSCPDNVLLERYSGKRVDSLTGDVYHLLFQPPQSADVANRLIEEPGGVQVNMHDKLSQYHRHSTALLECYSVSSKHFNADQPLNDIFEEGLHAWSIAVYSFLCTAPRTMAPHTPRVLLLGPTGSGKSLQALHLARTYNLVPVDCRELIHRTLNSGSKIADKIKPFHERGMMIPDDMVLALLSKRLSQLDCSTRGWVLHGYPLTRDQAELLNTHNLCPTRVFFLNIPEDSVKERLTLRRVDPVTGERYHLLFKPPQSQEIKDRLNTHPRDTETKVSQRLTMYNSHVEELVDCYPWGQHVNADQDPLTVFECIESMLVTPLPKQPAPTLTQGHD